MFSVKLFWLAVVALLTTITLIWVEPLRRSCAFQSAAGGVAFGYAVCRDHWTGRMSVRLVELAGDPLPTVIVSPEKELFDPLGIRPR